MMMPGIGIPQEPALRMPPVARRESSGRRGLGHAPAFAQVAAGNRGELPR